MFESNVSKYNGRDFEKKKQREVIRGKTTKIERSLV